MGFEQLDMNRRKKIVNNPKEDKDRACESLTKGD